MKHKSFFIFLFSVCFSISAYAQNTKEIHGTIIDGTFNEPVIGASVVIADNPSVGTISDIDGRFTLSVPVGSVMSITYVGYKPKTFTVTDSQTAYKITIDEDLKTLDEVVVVGFGTQKKVNLTGAVATVDNKALESRPVAQVGQALQGVVPGLNMSVNNAGGALGNRMNINIRGVGTIGEGSSSAPLVLIDGIEGDMNALNPDDIENISVLKDAAASSIYGSRAPFGVILITTKSGKSGKTQINYSNNLRWNSNINVPDMMDSYTFAKYFNTAAANSSQDLPFTEETIDRIIAFQKGEITTTTIPNPNNGMYEFHQKANDNQNWVKNHFKTGFSQEHNLNFTGGSDKTTYFISAALTDQKGNLRYGDDSFNRINASAKIDTEVTNWLKVGVNARFIREDIDRPTYASEDPESGTEGLFYHDISRTWPTMPFKDPNGNFMRNSKLIQLTEGGRHKRRLDTHYLQANIIATPLKDWNITANLSFKSEQLNKRENLAKIYEYTSDNEPVLLAFAGNYGPGSTYAMSSKTNRDLLTTSVHTDYSFAINNHNLKVMTGFNSELFKADYLYAKRDDVISDSTPNINAAMGKDYTAASLNDWATAGFFGRINYDYEGKYLVEVNLRYDGTSRFLGSKRWNLFPSFSLGYNIAREEFWESIEPYIGTLKPRFSWGKLGNQNTTSFYPFYSNQPLAVKGGQWLMDKERPTTATAPLIVSSLMGWEKIVTSNIGLDFGAFGNRLTGSIEWYKRDTKDMVGPPEEKSSIIGIDTGNLPRINNAAITTKGWEFAIAWNDQIGKVNYNVGLTVADSKTKVTKYPNLEKNLNQPYKGRYLGDIWGYQTVGIAKTDEEMQEHLKQVDQSLLGSKWGAGDIMYEDLDGDNKISIGSNTANNPGDMKKLGNSTPRFQYGISLGMDWKGIDFRAFFQGVGKRDVWLSGNYFWGVTGNIWQSIGYSEHNDYFRPEGHELGANLNSYFPKPYFDNMNASKNQQTQSKYMQNGAYIRLKNIQVGYTLPTHIIAKAGLTKLRLFFSADNLFTATSVFGSFDPETIGGVFGNGKIYPLSRTFSFGVNISL